MSLLRPVRTARCSQGCGVQNCPACRRVRSTRRVAGSVPYALACFVLAVVFTVGVATGGRVAAVRDPVVEKEMV